MNKIFILDAVFIISLVIGMGLTVIGAALNQQLGLFGPILLGIGMFCSFKAVQYRSKEEYNARYLP